MGAIPAAEQAQITGGNAARIWDLVAAGVVTRSRGARVADRVEREALQRALVHVLDDAGHERQELAGGGARPTAGTRTSSPGPTPARRVPGEELDAPRAAAPRRRST